jgi:hypothetical protein
MDVYLVPAGVDRYRLYAEPAAPAPVEGNGPARGWRGRLADFFWRIIQEGERAPAESEAVKHGRLRRWLSRTLASAVAEGRLLWHLRTASSARLVHPDDLGEPGARTAGLAVLAAERRKHLCWLLIDGALTVASVPFALVPGPNVIGYYFLVRAAGHYLSFRGAARGVKGVAWTTSASPALTTIRAALRMDTATRARHVGDVATALRLTRLVPFVEALAARPS